MDNKGEEEFQHDWYGILGCEVGSSKEDIVRAARKLAVKYHPDKTTDPEAPAKFLLTQKAKEILTDDTKKKKIDDHFTTIKKRQEYEQVRTKGMDESRKRFRDQLDAKIQKESETAKESANDILEREVRKRSKIIESMRKQNERMMEKSVDDMNAKLNAKNEAFKTYSKNLEETLKIKKYPIKIRWRKSDLSHSEDSLYQLFKAFGPIESISTESTTGTSATISFAEESAARSAIEYFATSEQYRVKALYEEEKEKKKAAVFTYQYTNSQGINSQLAEEVHKMKDVYEMQQELSTDDSPYGLKFYEGPFDVHAFEMKEKEVLQKLRDEAQRRKVQRRN